MGIYIKGLEMPKEDEEIIICINSSGTVMTQYGLPITGTKAVPVPEFNDIGSDPDDVWKKIFTLVVLLLSDKEKFDKLKDDMLTDMEE